MTTKVVLSHRHPITGKRNPYRTRWALVDGVVYEVKADTLDGLWNVSVDDTVIENVTLELAYLESGHWKSKWVFRLSDARQVIANWAEQLKHGEWVSPIEFAQQQGGN